jgi:CheY-like chemotaxis protein
MLMFDSTTPVVRISSHGPDAGAKKRTVLIFEDHQEADDAKEALRLISETQMDLIVTDFGLPEMDGLEFVSQAREKKRNQRDLKIALLTAYDPADYLDSALKVGCDLIISKPIDLDKVDRLIRLLPEQSGSHKVGACQLNAAHISSSI